jgi:hypothetical protein
MKKNVVYKRRIAKIAKPTDIDEVEELYEKIKLNPKKTFEDGVRYHADLETYYDLKGKKERSQADIQTIKKTTEKGKKYYLNIAFHYKVIYYTQNPPYITEPMADTIDITVSQKNISASVVQGLVESHLTQNETEYSKYILVSVDNFHFIQHDEIVKNANYNTPSELMKSASHLSFAWVPDIKFEENGQCVYNALDFLSQSNFPKVFKRNKSIKFFQECENNDAKLQTREPEILTFDSGVKPIWIHALCQQYNITHYCLDIENNLILKFVPPHSAQNYSPLCYISHDNHMYLITDKKFVTKLSHTERKAEDSESKFVLKMLQENNDAEDDTAIDLDMFDDVPIDRINTLNACIVVYQTKDLTPQLQELYLLTGNIYQHYSRNKRIVKILYKKDEDNTITLTVDPNFALDHDITEKPKDEDIKEEVKEEVKEGEIIPVVPKVLLTYKNVKEICDSLNIPFNNQPITSIIHNIGFNNDRHKRIRWTKQIKTEILQRQESKCNVCNAQLKKYHIDHIQPLSNNGTNELPNLQALCIECHAKKSKDEQDNGEYYSIPEYASTFNQRCRNVVLADSFNSYAFIERVSSPAETLKSYYVDINKCRRNILLHLHESDLKLPVFTVMDDIKPFDHTIDTVKVGFYFVESNNYLPLRNNGWYYYGVVDYCLQKNLIQKSNIKYKFESSISLDGDHFNEAIDKLTKLPHNLGKQSVNFFVGLMRKGLTQTDKMYYTKSFRQASSRFLKTTDKEMFIKKTKFGDDDIFQVITSTKLETDYYTNVLYKMVVDMEALELHKLKSIVEENNGTVTNYNTDCVECFFTDDKAIDVKAYFWDNAKLIEKYKFETKTKAPDRERLKDFTHDANCFFEQHEWNVIPDPEHDNFTELIDMIIDSKQSWNIDGVAGAGKTFLLKSLMNTLTEKNINFKVLTPTNKACRVISKDALTIHKFLACSFKNMDSLKKQLIDIDYIIVDEISMVREIFYSIFITIMRMKPSIKFILAGDIKRQLKPVNDRADFDYESSRALWEICNGNRLELTKCRRSDKKLFDVSMNVNNINIDDFGKEECNLSICFTNRKRIELNHYWMDATNKKNKTKCLRIPKLSYDPNSQDMLVYKNLPIIARINSKSYDIANNQTFVVTRLSNDIITITDDDETFKEIKKEDFNKLFYPAYAITTHKSQGGTIDRPFTIYEWYRFDERLKYTAITRAKNFSDISIVP